MNETQRNTLFTFDEAIKAEYKGNVNDTHLYDGYCSEEWRIGSAQHGGYLVSMILNAFTHHFRNVHPHPLHISVHFLDKSASGPCVIEINDIKPGKNSSIASAILKQTKNDNMKDEGYIGKVYAIVIFGNLSKEKGASPPFFDIVPIANKSNCELLELHPLISMRDRIEVLVDIPTKNLNRTEIKQWTKFTDQKELDIISLGMFNDLFFPGFSINGTRKDIWLPTLTLEIQFKTLPKGQWVASSFRSRFLKNGRYEVDGELWDESGNLLCITRHMCLITSWKKNVRNSKL